MAPPAIKQVGPFGVPRSVELASIHPTGWARGPCPFGSGYLSQAVPSLSRSNADR